MKTIGTMVFEANLSARRVFGLDIEITIARAQCWGHADNCLIFRGAKHAAAALSFASVVPGAKVEQQNGTAWPEQGLPAYTYTTVEFSIDKENPQ